MKIIMDLSLNENIMKNKVIKLTAAQKQELKQDLEKLKGRVLFPEKVELANQLLSRIVLPTNF